MECSPRKVSCQQLLKPLQGYSFYIDVEDDDDVGREAVELLAGKIISLGGNVRKILSQSVYYFITAGTKKQRVKIRRSARFLKQNETRAKKKLRSPILKNEVPLLSTIDRAKKLGLNIFTIDKVTKWLTEIERRRLCLSPEKCTNGETQNDGQLHSPTNLLNNSDLKSIGSLTRFKYTSKNNDEELQPPFIKIEDRDKVYEPQYLELTTFPTICFETCVPRSPFQKLDFNGIVINSGSNVVQAEKTSKKLQQTISSTSNYSKSGYCDFCECFFRRRDQHIQTKKHQLNIPYENFKKLDDLIVNGVPFDDFLKTVLKKKISQEVLDKMERKKELSKFLKTLDGKRKAREFFTDLNGFVDYTERRKEFSERNDENGKNEIIR